MPFFAPDVASHFVAAWFDGHYARRYGAASSYWLALALAAIFNNDRAFSPARLPPSSLPRQSSPPPRHAIVDLLLWAIRFRRGRVKRF